MWSLFSKDPAASFGYKVGDFVCSFGLWNLHECKKRGAETSGEFSLFLVDVSKVTADQVETAKATQKRSKTLRHPNLLLYIDGLESDKFLYIVTEKITPLSIYLQKSCDVGGNFTFMSSWGLYQVAQALSFLNKDCSLVHGNVRLESVFVTRSGEWKLHGFDKVMEANGQDLSAHLPEHEFYMPPDLRRLRRPKDLLTIDSWSLGALIWRVFNTGLPDSHEKLRQFGKVPGALIPQYSSLIQQKAGQRTSAADFLEAGSRPGGFFDNFYVESLQFLEQFQIKDQEEKSQFLRSLGDKVQNFPEDVAKYKILPHLLESFQFGGGGSDVLTPLLKLSKLLDKSEFEGNIVPCLVKLFSSPDRATRVRLLEQLPSFVDHLPEKVTNDQIFPPVVQGLSDTNPVVREHTIRAIVYLAPKLAAKTINDDVPRHLTRLQTKDDQGGIRANASVCLSKVAGLMSANIRQGPLLQAFLRCLRDPFAPARQAAMGALVSTMSFYTLRDTAGRLLPGLCCLLVDPSVEVRNQAFPAVRSVLARLEKASGDPAVAEEMEAECNAAKGTASAESGAAGWANWAVSALSNKFSKTSKSGVTKEQKVDKLEAERSESPSPTLSIEKKEDETKDDLFKPNITSKKEFAKDNNYKDTSRIAWGSDKPRKITPPPVAAPVGDGWDDGGDGWDDFDNDSDKDDDQGWDSLEPDVDVQRKTSTSPPPSSKMKTSSEWDNDWDADNFFESAQQAPLPQPAKKTLLTKSKEQQPPPTRSSGGGMKLSSSKKTIQPSTADPVADILRESGDRKPASKKLAAKTKEVEDDGWGDW